MQGSTAPAAAVARIGRELPAQERLRNGGIEGHPLGKPVEAATVRFSGAARLPSLPLPVRLLPLLLRRPQRRSCCC